MRVKICGITNLEDALFAVDEGADAIGFIFYPRSSRFISPEDAFEITQKLPPFVEKVGVFVDSDAKYINKAIALSGITLAQIHFEATNALYGSLIAPHLRVVRAQREEDIDYLGDRYRLVDTSIQNKGEQVEKLDLNWFEGKDCSKIILSGGLSSENIEQTLSYGFYGVDVNFGVESAQGKKDRDRVKAFIRTAKQH